MEVAGHGFSGSWEALRHLQHLRELSVQDVACWRRLRASLPALGTVTSLAVGGGGAELTERIWQELAGATQLRALALHRFAVRPLPAVARSFEHLTRLSIRGVGYEFEGRSPAPSDFLLDDRPSLVVFIQDATRGSYYAYNRRVVASLRHLPPRLLDLELSACLLHSVPPSLSALPLTRLVLSYNTFDGDPLRALRPLRPTLAELSLRHCWLYVEPAVLRNLTGCSHLDLSANPISRGFRHRYTLDTTGDWASTIHRRTACLCLTCWASCSSRFPCSTASWSRRGTRSHASAACALHAAGPVPTSHAWWRLRLPMRCPTGTSCSLLASTAPDLHPHPALPFLL